MRLFFGLLFLLPIAACRGSSDNLTQPQPGTLQVTTITNGPQSDADGYSVGLDGADQGAIGLDAMLRIPDVEPGDHTVQLNGVADNCTVSGENPRAIAIPPGALTVVNFQVSCLGTPGSLEITTATAGSSLDPNGYIITLDGKDRLRIGVNEAVTFSNLTPGSHLVGLRDIAPNCLLQGESPRSVTIAGGASRTTAFTISCAP